MKELKVYISADKGSLSIRKQSELLGISRSSVYYQEKGESTENLEIMQLMDEEFLDHTQLPLSD